MSGSPFNDGSRYSAGVGLDLKYGLGTGMTLVGAVNPDFGQVEVDPAVVNLTAFETFFEEKRPFFTEGSQVFLRFGRSGAIDYTTYFYPEPLLFYSRRIGRAPQGQAAGAVRGHAGLDDDPGRGQARRSQPRLERRRAGRAHRAGVRADRRRGGTRSELEVEPLTNYFVGRAQRDLGSRGASASWGRPRTATCARRASRPSSPSAPSWAASTGTSSSTAGATGSSPAGSRAAPSPAAAPPCCACSARAALLPAARRAARVGRSRRRPRSRAGAAGWASTRTAATSPSMPPCGGSAPASSPTTSASRPRPTAAAPTRRCSSGSSPPTASPAAASSRSPSGGPSTSAASRRVTASSSPRARSCATTGSST